MTKTPATEKPITQVWMNEWTITQKAIRKPTSALIENGVADSSHASMPCIGPNEVLKAALHRKTFFTSKSALETSGVILMIHTFVIPMVQSDQSGSSIDVKKD